MERRVQITLEQVKLKSNLSLSTDNCTLTTVVCFKDALVQLFLHNSRLERKSEMFRYAGYSCENPDFCCSRHAAEEVYVALLLMHGGL